MLRGKYFILVLIILFIVRLLLQSQLVIPLNRLIAPKISGLFFILAGDTPGYVNPWKNVLRVGIYSEDGVHPTANRMPYTGLPFFLVYLLVRDDVIAYNVVATLQILLGTIAILFMANFSYKVCLDIGQSKKIALISGIIYVILATSSLTNLFLDGMILPDGPGTSFLALFIFHYYEYLSTTQKRHLSLIWSSIFLALTCLWRPYYVLLYPVVILFEIYKSKSILIKSLLTKILVLIIPISLIDLPWIVRNFITLRRFIPAQSDLYAGTCDRVCVAYRNFAKIAGSIWHIFQSPNSMACYFENIDYSRCLFRFPSYMLGEKLNIKEIEKVKYLYIIYKQNPNIPSLEDSVVNAFSNLVSYYRQDHPYLYWLYPRLISLKMFFIHGHAMYTSYQESVKKVGKIPYLTFRIIQGSIYWIGLVIGFIGLIFLVRKKRETYMLLLTPVYLTLLFPIYIITHEVRYFYAAHPILLVGASIQIAFMLKNTPLWRLPVFKSLAQIS